MDKNILFEFIKQTSEENVRKYARIVTESLTKPQLLDLANLFEVKVDLKEEKKEVVKEPKKVVKKESKKYTEAEIEAMINAESEKEGDDIDFD